jgi:hypothetical protein
MDLFILQNYYRVIADLTNDSIQKSSTKISRKGPKRMQRNEESLEDQGLQ